MAVQSGWWTKRWVRMPLGAIATAAASLLAFHAGQDIAQVAFGSGAAEAAPAVVAMPTPVPAVAQKQVEGPFVVTSILPINEPS